MTDLEYQYGGQWFNDMGSLVFSFPNEPALGMDIARGGLTRAQANDMATALIRGSAPARQTPGMNLGV